MQSLFFFFRLLSLLSPVAFASEIDEITHHDRPLRDSLPVLEERVQKAFDQALARSIGCDAKAFGAAVAAEIVSWHYYSGAIEKFLWTDPRVDRIQVSVADSVYANSPFSRSLIGITYGLDPVVNLGGHRVGTDKAGHFFDHGHKLHQLATAGTDLAALLAYTVDEEEGAFGWLTTGVKSYADLAANMSGLLFWRNTYGEGPSSYVSCKNGRLVQIRPLHLDEYVSSAWSESKNCNAYAANLRETDEEGFVSARLDAGADNAFARAVERNLKERAAAGERAFCLARSDRCTEMREWFLGRVPPEVAAKVISPICGER